MAIRRPPTTFSDTISTTDIADDAISGDKLANDISISTTGNIATTGSGTLTVAGNTTLSGTNNLGSNPTVTLGSNATFPAGHVLQIKSHYTIQGQTNSGSSASYFIQSNGTWSSGSSSPWGNITTTKANSTLVYFLTSTAYFAVGTVSGQFADWEQFIRYSTNSDLSSSTDTTSLVRVYEDARSTNGVSGQSKYGGSGTFAVTSSHASGTTIYYTVKSVMAYSGVSNPTTLQVMELAT